MIGQVGSIKDWTSEKSKYDNMHMPLNHSQGDCGASNSHLKFRSRRFSRCQSSCEPHVFMVEQKVPTLGSGMMALKYSHKLYWKEYSDIINMMLLICVCCVILFHLFCSNDTKN
jgi:hypothetical protein